MTQRCKCGSTECGLIHVSQISEYQCGSCVIKTYEEVAKLRIGCQLTLDFHSGRQWTDEDAANWEKHTGKKEATNRILCDTIQELMK